MECGLERNCATFNDFPSLDQIFKVAPRSVVYNQHPDPALWQRTLFGGPLDGQLCAEHLIMAVRATHRVGRKLGYAKAQHAEAESLLRPRHPQTTVQRPVPK